MIRQLTSIKDEDEAFVGKRIIALSRIQNDKKLLLPSVILTTQSFKDFVDKSRIKQQLIGLMERTGNIDEELFELSEMIQGLIIKTDFDEQTKEEIEDAYHSLDVNYEKTKTKDLLSSSGSPVVSVTAMDVTIDGNSKQLELPKHLNVIGQDYLESAIKHCWASQFTKEFLKEHNKLNSLPSKISILIQKMIHPVKSIHAYSINVENRDNTKIMIKVAYGLPYILINQGESYDVYIVGKANLQIDSIAVGEQKYAFKADYDTDRIEKTAVPKEVGQKQKISDKEIWEIAGIVRRITRDLQVELMIEFLDDTQRRFISNVELLNSTYEDIEKRTSEEYHSKNKQEEITNEKGRDFLEEKSRIPEKIETIDLHEAGLQKAKERDIIKNISVEENQQETEQPQKPMHNQTNKMVLEIMPFAKRRMQEIDGEEKEEIVWIITKFESTNTISYEDFVKLLGFVKKDYFDP